MVVSSNKMTPAITLVITAAGASNVRSFVCLKI